MLESRYLQMHAWEDGLKHSSESWHIPVKTNTDAVLFVPQDITWSVCFSTVIIPFFLLQKTPNKY